MFLFVLFVTSAAVVGGAFVVVRRKRKTGMNPAR
jgi:hypothetical protein